MTSVVHRQPGYSQLLRRPQYPSFVLTVFLSRISVMMFNSAAVLLVLQRAGSPALAGATVAAATLPAALSAPLLGCASGLTSIEHPVADGAVRRQLGDRVLPAGARLAVR